MSMKHRGPGTICKINTDLMEISCCTDAATFICIFDKNVALTAIFSNRFPIYELKETRCACAPNRIQSKAAIFQSTESVRTNYT